MHAYPATHVARLAAIAAALLAAAAPSWSATPAPIPVTVTNPSLAVQPAMTPFSTQLYISIPNGSTIGGDNYNLSGGQTFLVPTGKRLVIQSVSVFRSGASAGSSAQVFVNASLGGLYTSWPTPLFSAPGSTYPGIMQPMTIYADGGTAVLVNGFRSTSTNGEQLTVGISGYLVPMP